jgi:hypothetical protein
MFPKKTAYGPPFPRSIFATAASTDSTTQQRLAFTEGMMHYPEIIRSTNILDKTTWKPTNLLSEVFVRNNNQKAEVVHLKSVCGSGDDGEPVLTIMLPSED